MTGKIDDYAVLNFSLSNPMGEGQGDVAKLLRSLADSIESLGDVQIQDITFGSEVTDGEDDLHFTVYYHRESRRR
jgi:hypothetical protein